MAGILRCILKQQRSYLSRLTLISPYSSTSKQDSIRIGCSSGFWGDSADAAPQLIRHGNLDVLVADYLSEITMSLLVAARRKSPDLGYTPDFIRHIKPVLSDIKRHGVQVVANAGGINPEGCVNALKELASSQGVELSVAMVTGDDLMKYLQEIKDSSLAVDMDTGLPLPKSVLSMNAYLGGFPIADALNKGADIVITGRCTDSALVLGPLINKFGWKETDYDLLASGSLAGHLIECGAQVTGGIFTDWDNVEGWDNIGFPIVECYNDGSFVVTKPPDTGGVVNYGTVAEQIVYEIDDPTNYILPDVSCDFSQVMLTELPNVGVLVKGAKGYPATPTYKVSTTFMDGYRTIAVTPMIGPRGPEKLQKTAEAILKRTRRMFKENGFEDYSDTFIKILGDSSSAVLWLGLKHQQKEALTLFTQEIAPAGTGMAPGLTAMVGGRPKVTPVLKLMSFLYPKEKLPVTVSMDDKILSEKTYCSPSIETTTKRDKQHTPNIEVIDITTLSTVLPKNVKYLQDIAYMRSGDKGNTANIGVICRKPEYYQYLKQFLTKEIVADQFKNYLEPSESETYLDLVTRYELSGINGLNFVLRKSLGGGGVASIRNDPQGKGYAQMLAELQLEK